MKKENWQTRERLERIEKAENALIPLYWELKDNHESERIAKRIDTILGKLYELKKID